MKRDATLEKIWRMSNGNGKPRKSTSCSTKRMAATLLALTWPWHFKALTLTTLRIMQLKTQKHYMHVDGRPKKVFTVSRGRLYLMYVMHLSDDNAAASSTDVKPRWRSWDEDYAKGYQRHPQRNRTRDTLCFLVEFNI